VRGKRLGAELLDGFEQHETDQVHVASVQRDLRLGSPTRCAIFNFSASAKRSVMVGMKASPGGRKVKLIKRLQSPYLNDDGILRRKLKNRNRFTQDPAKKQHLANHTPQGQRHRT
jgi:hypothetical protein